MEIICTKETKDRLWQLIQAAGETEELTIGLSEQALQFGGFFSYERTDITRRKGFVITTQLTSVWDRRYYDLANENVSQRLMAKLQTSRLAATRDRHELDNPFLRLTVGRTTTQCRLGPAPMVILTARFPESFEQSRFNATIDDYSWAYMHVISACTEVSNVWKGKPGKSVLMKQQEAEQIEFTVRSISTAPVYVNQNRNRDNNNAWE